MFIYIYIYNKTKLGNSSCSIFLVPKNRIAWMDQNSEKFYTVKAKTKETQRCTKLGVGNLFKKILPIRNIKCT